MNLSVHRINGLSVILGLLSLYLIGYPILSIGVQEIGWIPIFIVCVSFFSCFSWLLRNDQLSKTGTAVYTISIGLYGMLGVFLFFHRYALLISWIAVTVLMLRKLTGRKLNSRESQLIMTVLNTIIAALIHFGIKV